MRVRSLANMRTSSLQTDRLPISSDTRTENKGQAWHTTKIMILYNIMLMLQDLMPLIMSWAGRTVAAVCGIGVGPAEANETKTETETETFQAAFT